MKKILMAIITHHPGHWFLPASRWFFLIVFFFSFLLTSFSTLCSHWLINGCQLSKRTTRVIKIQEHLSNFYSRMGDSFDVIFFLDVRRILNSSWSSFTTSWLLIQWIRQPNFKPKSKLILKPNSKSRITVGAVALHKTEFYAYTGEHRCESSLLPCSQRCSEFRLRRTRLQGIFLPSVTCFDEKLFKKLRHHSNL